MWVVFDANTLEVEKTFVNKSDAEALRKHLEWTRHRYSTSVYAVEKFETGKLDAWLTWKALTK